MYERECQEKKVWETCFYLTERHYQGIFYTRHLYLVMASYSASKGCFVWYVCRDVHKIVVKMRGWGHFLRIMKDANVSRFWPLCVVYVKLNVQDILYNFFLKQIYFFLEYLLLVFVGPWACFQSSSGNSGTLDVKKSKKSWEQCLCVSSPVGLRCGQMSAFFPLLMSGFLSPTGPVTPRQVTGPDLSIEQCRHTHYQSLRQRFKEEEDDTARSLSKIKDNWQLCCNWGTEKKAINVAQQIWPSLNKKDFRFGYDCSVYRNKCSILQATNAV